MARPAALKTALLALLLCAGACAKKEQVVIFATGRSQGRIWADAEAGTGGFAVFKKLYDSEPAPKLALDLGNWSSATREGWLSRGRSTAACVSAVPYAAAGAGLEDLSLSPAELQKMAEASTVPLLASNLYLKNNKKPDFLRSQVITQAGGRKIGVFSLIIHSPSKPNSARNVPNYRLEKETYETERALKALKDGGAQLTVMLLSVNPKEKAAPEYFRAFLAKLPRVDLVITDEPSVKKAFRVGKTWVAPAGLEMSHAARLALTLEAGTGRLSRVRVKQLPLSVKKYGEDPAMLKVIDGFRKIAAAHFGRKIGRLTSPLPLEDHGVSPAADFAADCMRRWARTNAAIIGLKEPAAGFESGDVTVGDLHDSFPLDSSVVFVKIRGDDLERALAGLNPGELSVSGLKLFLRDGALEKAETETGPLVPGRVYHVAVPDSLVTGRENPVLSSAMEFANSRRHLREVVGWCFSRQSSFSRPAGGRIIKAGAD
ncbi:MAG TPA: hypothetical protein DEQ38_08625 [Elusimicrobia bacterium]|nr:MAG: hypothetical protein A2089_09535 [Elusimicrobia bacterium GWD2_63_28]HCC48158.1 hypothetical protein [Elusimicrobiota bacterium]